MRQTFIISAILCCMMFIGCSDDDKVSTSYDPTQPVVFTDFSPKEGQVRTRLYIYGKNFGTDETKIHVNVGGQDAKVIGSTGEIIYCMVKKRSYDGNVTVTIDGEDGKPAVVKTFDEKFNYVAKTTVGTLLRVVDEYGNSGFTDGSFDDGASVPSNDWMVFDPKFKEMVATVCSSHVTSTTVCACSTSHRELLHVCSHVHSTAPCTRSRLLPTATHSSSPTTTETPPTNREQTFTTVCALKDSRNCVLTTTDLAHTAWFVCQTEQSSTLHGQTPPYTEWRTRPEKYLTST